MDLKSRPLAAALASGTALALSFAGSVGSVLAWLALVPYLLFLQSRPKWIATLSAHFLLSIVYFGGVLYWIPRVLVRYGNFGWPAAAALFLAMLALLAVFLLPFTLLTRWAADKDATRFALVAPAAWTLSELIRDRFAVGGFPWGLLGASQPPDAYWSQIADLAGVYGVGFLLVAFSAAVAGLLRKKRDWRLAGAVLLVWIASGLYGAYRIHFWSPPERDRIKVALVQPGIALDRDRDYYAQAYFETLPKYYAAAVEAGAQWVIFPEAPCPFVFERDFYFTTFWRRLVADHQTPLLFPSPAVDAERGLRYNSLFQLAPGGQAVFRYDKVHLVPFGEYLPWGDVLGFAAPLTRDVGGFQPGDPSAGPGEVAGLRFAPLICYEGIFPELARDGVRRGAELLVNVTNDAWFGPTAAPRQHLRLASFRAVEQRKPLLRAANNGIVVFVDPWGRSSQLLPYDQTGTLTAEVPANAFRTLYSYLGDWPAALVGALAVVAAALPRRRRIKKRKKRRARAC